MAITAAAITGGVNDDTTDGTVFTTASLTATGGIDGVLAFISWSSGSTMPTYPTLTGMGLTWALLSDGVNNGHHLYDNTATTRNAMAVYKGTGTPSAGAVTITFASTATACGWAFIEIDGATPTLTVEQIVKTTAEPASATSGAITLAAAADALNRPFSFWHHQAAEATVPQTSWTELADGSYSSSSGGYEVQWRSDQFDTAAAASWVTSQTYGGVAFELVEASAAADPTPVGFLKWGGDLVPVSAQVKVGGVLYPGL
jgi:hypothetical protein